MILATDRRGGIPRDGWDAPTAIPPNRALPVTTVWAQPELASRQLFLSNKPLCQLSLVAEVDWAGKPAIAARGSSFAPAVPIELKFWILHSQYSPGLGKRAFSCETKQISLPVVPSTSRVVRACKNVGKDIDRM